VSGVDKWYCEFDSFFAMTIDSLLSKFYICHIQFNDRSVDPAQFKCYIQCFSDVLQQTSYRKFLKRKTYRDNVETGFIFVTIFNIIMVTLFFKICYLLNWLAGQLLWCAVTETLMSVCNV
jgi:hypothetical protein